MVIRPYQKQENRTKLAAMDSSCGMCAINSRRDRHLTSFATPSPHATISSWIFSAVVVTPLCADSPALGYSSLQAPLTKNGGGIPPGPTLQAAGSQSRSRPITCTSPIGRRLQRLTPLPIPCCARIRHHGQLHGEGGALRQLALHLDGASMSLHQHPAQSQAQADSPRLGGEERLRPCPSGTRTPRGAQE